MVAKKYIPDRGDIIWITLDPARGREQKGRRPALVLSPKNYNRKTDLLFACPITSHCRGYPFEVEVDIAGIDGVILVDQARCIAWKERGAVKLSKVSFNTLSLVQEKLKMLLFT
ncbi:MAG: endoribonuclease MazF [bacterium]|nr:endoribonuclease MazF [bacterium]